LLSPTTVPRSSGRGERKKEGRRPDTNPTHSLEEKGRGGKERERYICFPSSSITPKHTRGGKGEKEKKKGRVPSTMKGGGQEERRGVSSVNLCSQFLDFNQERKGEKEKRGNSLLRKRKRKEGGMSNFFFFECREEEEKKKGRTAVPRIKKGRMRGGRRQHTTTTFPMKKKKGRGKK